MNNYDLHITQEPHGNDVLQEFAAVNQPVLFITNFKYLGLSFRPNLSTLGEIKYRNKGKSNLLYPTIVGSQYVKGLKYPKVRLAREGENPDGQVLFSKNEYRLSHRFLLHLKKESLKVKIKEEIEKFLDRYNNYLCHQTYRCKFTYGGKHYDIRFAVGDSYIRLVKSIQSELDFLDDDFDDALVRECKKIFGRV